MSLPDIVYVVRPGEANHELRFSLRSLAKHVPHGRVWIAGYKPSWIRGVGHVRTLQQGSKYANSTMNLRAACEHPDVAEDVLLFNDDFYAMSPLTGPMPVYHRGSVAHVEQFYADRADGSYLAGLRETRDLLAELGHDDPLCYELHVPLPVRKTAMAEALRYAEKVQTAFHKRTFYGVTNNLGGDRLLDPKVMTIGKDFARGVAWLSSAPAAFRRGEVGRFVRAAFPDPCQYEGRLTTWH